MTVRSLGYIVVGASDIQGWRVYAANVLGVQVDEDLDGGLKLRIDSRDWRIRIEPGSDDIVAAGWEVAGPEALRALVERLSREGVAVQIDPALAARRGVRELARFVDPAGVPGEVFWGATERLEKPFVSPTGMSGFVVGDQGLGHIVLAAADPQAMHDFYADFLGFRTSDFIDMPAGPGQVLPIEFMHCNARHHTLAFAPAPAPKKLLHFMLQTQSLDDVGFALDRLTAQGGELALTLGKHVNDQMVSFYAYSPSGFEIEYGHGACVIDARTWLPTRHDRISMWGHKFVGRPGTVQA